MYTEDPGNACESGGVRVEYGVDANGDDILQSRRPAMRRTWPSRRFDDHLGCWAYTFNFASDLSATERHGCRPGLSCTRRQYHV
jgi:hypothetical protein